MNSEVISFIIMTNCSNRSNNRASQMQGYKSIWQQIKEKQTVIDLSLQNNMTSVAVLWLVADTDRIKLGHPIFNQSLKA